MNFAPKSIDRPVLTVIVFVLIGLVSLFTLSDITIGLMPDMDMPMLMVSTSYDSAGPESVEKSVTKVLESALSGLTNLESMTSQSSEGSSLISLEFAYGTNLDESVNDIRDKIDRVKSSLPDEASSPTIMKFDSSSMPVMKIAVRGNRSAEDLKEIAEDYLEDRLQQADGVGQVSVSGGRDKIVRVEISQNRLDAYDLTMTEVSAALAKQNLETGGGKIGEGSKNYIIRTVGEYKSVQDINDAVVAEKNGYVVRLSDIGTAFEGFEDISSYVYINGEPGVYVSVTKQSDANTVDVADAVSAKLEEIKTILPQDITLEVISDDSTQVRSTLAALLDSAWLGAVLAMLVLFLFLRNIKSTLIMGISIPFSILITLLCMKFAGITMNMMTMTGLILGVGMVVDASVVVLENIYQYRERGTKPAVAAAIGTQEMFGSVLSGNLTTICVFIPIIFYQSKLGMIGQMFPDIIFTIIIALLSSLFVALFLVPVLAGKFLVIRTRKEKPLKNRVIRAVDETVDTGLKNLALAYRRSLSFVLRHKGSTLIVVLGMFVLSLALTSRLNIVLMPNMRDESVTLEAELPIGTKIEETQALLLQFEQIVRDEIEGYESIITTVGSGSGFRSSDKTYSGTISVNLPDAELQIDTMDTVRQKLRAHFNDFPSASFSFSAGMMKNMTGSDIDIALRSDDLDAALETAQTIKQIIKEKIPDVSEAVIDVSEGLPQVEIEIDRDRAYAFGVDVSSAAAEVNAAVQGITSTIYRSKGKEYNVVLMFRDEDRSKVIDLEQIYVQGTNGRVALSNFASLVKGLGPVSVNRENQTRIVHIEADILTNKRANEVEQDIKQAIEDSMILDDSISMTFEGSWKDIGETAVVFLLIVIMALLLVYGVMAGTYESFKDPFINMFTIPLGLIGVIAIYLITGSNLSMFTAFGFVMLVGIAVNNGIILVDQINLLRGRGTAMYDACLDASASRLRPILMSTLTTLLGMFPLAFFPSANGEMLQPIGLCVFGGLLSSSLITLYVIPVLYAVFNRAKRNKEIKPCIEQK